MKTTSAPTKPGNVIPEMDNEMAFQCMEALNHEQMAHATEVNVTSDGKYHFSAGNEHSEFVELDPNNTQDALLIRQGKKQKKLKLPGLYIGSKKIVKTYEPDEIIDKAEEIIAAHKSYVKARKKIELALRGEDAGLTASETLQVVTELLAKGAAKSTAEPEEEKAEPAPAEPVKSVVKGKATK